MFSRYFRKVIFFFLVISFYFDHCKKNNFIKCVPTISNELSELQVSKFWWHQINFFSEADQQYKKHEVPSHKRNN